MIDTDYVITITKAGRDVVLKDVEAERHHQIGRWEGVFDDNMYTPRTWLDLMGKYASRLYGEEGALTTRDTRLNFIKIAALAVAAVEALDNKASV